MKTQQVNKADFQVVHDKACNGEISDTHINNCSSEASSTQDKVCHIGGATRNPKGHVSHWSW